MSEENRIRKSELDLNLKIYRTASRIGQIVIALFFISNPLYALTPANGEVTPTCGSNGNTNSYLTHVGFQNSDGEFINKSKKLEATNKADAIKECSGWVAKKSPQLEPLLPTLPSIACPNCPRGTFGQDGTSVCGPLNVTVDDLSVKQNKDGSYTCRTIARSFEVTFDCGPCKAGSCCSSGACESLDDF